MTPREKLHRTLLRKSISVTPLEDNDVDIICPKVVSEKLHPYLREAGFNAQLPSEVITGLEYSVLVMGCDKDIELIINQFCAEQPLPFQGG